MVYIVEGTFNIPDDLITIKDLLKKFNLELLLPKKILELEVPNDFTSYQYIKHFDDLSEDEQEDYHDSYDCDIDDGIIDSIDDVFESFHRFTGEFHMIEIKECPLNGLTVDDIPDDEDVGELFLKMDNLDFAISSCLMYYEFPSHNLVGFPLIIEYEWSGYQSPIMYN